MAAFPELNKGQLAVRDYLFHNTEATIWRLLDRTSASETDIKEMLELDYLFRLTEPVPGGGTLALYYNSTPEPTAEVA